MQNLGDAELANSYAPTFAFGSECIGSEGSPQLSSGRSPGRGPGDKKG